MNSKPKSAVYELRNLVNNKVYIGSTLNFNKRVSSHKHALNANKHHSSHLQASWNKHGGSNFIFRVLEFIPNATKQILEEREDYWINHFDSINKGFNKKTGTEEKYNRFYNNIEMQSYIQDFINSKIQEGCTLSNRQNTKSLIKLVFKNTHIESYTIDSNKTITKIHNSSECKDFILEICPTTKEILYTYKSIKEILIKYTDIKRGLMEQILYGKNNKRSASGRIFIQESEYLQNPDILKTLVVGKPPKPVAKIDVSKLPEIVILEHFKSTKEVLFNYPLNVKSLMSVLSKEKPTLQYPFIYQ